jgi:small subunit ribosomal protein S4e
MAHIKIQSTPKVWPTKRKGKTFIVKAASNSTKSMSVLTVLRDVLKLAQNRKEVKKIIHERKLLLNNSPVTDEKMGVALFDVITLSPNNKSYRVVIAENGKFDLIEEKSKGTKIAKVINKTKIKNNKTQINLSDGKNFISEIKCKVNDSFIIDLEKKSLLKCLTLSEKSKALVFEGKHAGEKGTIEEIDKEKELAVLNIEGKKVKVLIKQLMIIE